MTGLAGSIVPFQAWFDERRNKVCKSQFDLYEYWLMSMLHQKWRIVFFLSLCFASILPLTHLAIAKGPLNTLKFIRMSRVPSSKCSRCETDFVLAYISEPTLSSCLFYITGLIFYAFHFPECVFPGKFDFAYSHAIWHVFIILAIRSHYEGMSALKDASVVFSCAAKP